MSASGGIPPPCAATSGSTLARPARRGPALPGRTSSCRSGCPRTPRASGTPTRRATLLGSGSRASLPRPCGLWEAGARGGWCSWTTTPCCPRTTWWCAREVRLEGDGVRRGLVGEPLGQHLFQPRPLAAVLARTLDVCIERYPRLYGSDDRLHACITELGVPLSREYEFHHVCLGVHIFDRQTLIGALDCLRKCQLKAKFS
ncbi:hypothetical protein VPH35_104786 [Triticum aestivum]